jgi:FMN phosphatase YigB (HAD superfamily)
VAISEPQRLPELLAGVTRIVFDLDGTLYDTRDFERPALESVVGWLRARSGRPLPGLLSSLCERRESDRHRPGLFDELLLAHGLPAEWGSECARIFRAHPGAELANANSLRACLEHLRSEQCRLALVSNGRAEVQKRKLAQLGMLDLFDICVYCDPDRVEELKPARWGWIQLEQWRGSAPAAYVGDDPVDLQFAAAGAARFVHFRFRSSRYDH